MSVVIMFYQLTVCEAEDEVSCAAHLTMLEKQLSKARPNEDLVKEKIRKTAQSRQLFIQQPQSSKNFRGCQNRNWQVLSQYFRKEYNKQTFSFCPEYVCLLREGEQVGGKNNPT